MGRCEFCRKPVPASPTRSVDGPIPTRTGEPLPNYIDRPLRVDNDEPDWLRDDLRPPAAGPWEMGDTAAR